MSTTTAGAPAVGLDTSSEVWVGTFAGLGRIEVRPDGAYTVTVDPSVAEPDVAGARDALTYGWAAVVSSVRRGLHPALAACVTPADGLEAHGTEPPPALLIGGDRAGSAAVVALLLRDGWALVADGWTPLAVPRGPASPVLAHPRGGPALAPRRLRIDADTDVLTGRRPRTGSTAQQLGGQRLTRAAQVRARVTVDAHPAVDRPVLTPVTGRRRLEPMHALLDAQQLDLPQSPADILAIEAATAGLPLVTLGWPTGAEPTTDPAMYGRAIDALTAWWREVTT